METPYLLPEPAVVSFSGGRTSGYMSKKIIETHRAFGRPLPRFVFCNTGKEREETLKFVERCSLEWDFPIAWLEYRWEPGRHHFVEVNYATASRLGEPFRMAIMARSFLPNPVMRFCTAELKIRTTNRYVHQTLGWGDYHNAIGLRADEERRVLKMRAKRSTKYITTLWEEWVIKQTIRGAEHPPGEQPCQPLYDAGAKLEDVMAFWAAQPFDLQLRQEEGNCDLCFLKGANKLIALMKDRPESAQWWIETERLIQGRDRPETARFRADRPKYAELLLIAQGKQEGPGWLWADNGNVGACGESSECRCTD